MRIKLSQSDWKNIGIKMGWLKTAQQDPDKTYNMGDSHYDDFEEVDSEPEGGPFEVSYSLVTTEGISASKGRFMVEVSDIYSPNYNLNIERFILRKLEEILVGKACGPDGPVEEVFIMKTYSDTELEYKAIGQQGVTCGVIFVKRVDGKPFDTDSN